jgi:hypothetical protein
MAEVREQEVSHLVLFVPVGWGRWLQRIEGKSLILVLVERRSHACFTVSLFEIRFIIGASVPALGPEISAIPAPHKKPWIRTKDHLSSLPDPGRFASFDRLRCCSGNAHSVPGVAKTIR